MLRIDDAAREASLGSDALIQCDHREVVAAAHAIADIAASDKERAVAIFYWVRDTINYRVGIQSSAIEVLRARCGDSVSKAVLQVSLLRAVGLRARIGHVQYSTEALWLMFPDDYLDKQPDSYPNHAFAEVFLEGAWIACDATFDPDFACDFNFPVTEFDGEHPTEPAVGGDNVLLRAWSESASHLYEDACAFLGLTRDELRCHCELLDTYVRLARIRIHAEALQSRVEEKLAALARSGLSVP